MVPVVDKPTWPVDLICYTSSQARPDVMSSPCDLQPQTEKIQVIKLRFLPCILAGKAVNNSCSGVAGWKAVANLSSVTRWYQLAWFNKCSRRRLQRWPTSTLRRTWWEVLSLAALVASTLTRPMSSPLFTLPLDRYALTSLSPVLVYFFSNQVPVLLDSLP